jgi:hypothetical protein
MKNFVVSAVKLNQGFSVGVIILLLVLSMCSKENNTPAVIAPDFKTYVDRFVSEAASRGVNVDVSKLSVSYSDTLKYYCGWGDYKNKAIFISSLDGCWKTKSDLNKEILLFHEMGHAILGRSHDNNKLPNGDYKTMMFGGNQFDLYSEDSPERRKYYLDELFNSATPAPGWSSVKNNPTILLSDSINAKTTNWNYKKTDGTVQTGMFNSQVYLSPGTSMEIQSSSTSSTAFSYWYYSWAPQGINQSDRLQLTVNVKVDNVTGPGVYVALRGDSGAGTVFFHTTQGATKISGTSGFTSYTVDVPYYVTTAKYLIVFLIMDAQSTGTVYFDDVTVTKFN